MAINKVIYGEDTLVDLTEDTVTAEDVLNSKSFHTPDGVKRTGTASYPVTDVQVNGTSVMDGTVAKVEQPTADEKTATESFETVNGGLLQKCVVDLVPVQSGSGDPYPAGGGKNKLPLVLADIKSFNTIGTWSGNAYTQNGGTFTVLTDSASNIVGVNVNGTFSTATRFYLYRSVVKAGSYIINGGLSDDLAFGLRGTTNMIYSTGSDKAYTISDDKADAEANIVAANMTFNNVVVRPMLRLSSETDPTFAPYSNVRPISGHTEVDLQMDGKNWCSSNIEQGNLNTNGLNINSNYRLRTAQYIVVKGGETFTVSWNSSKITQYSISEFNVADFTTNRIANSNWLSSGTSHQLNNATTYIRIAFRPPTDVAVTPEDMSDLQIELGSSATIFEPYKGHLYQVQIGSTVYGGYVDLVSGVMTVTHEYIEYDGSSDENWIRGNPYYRFLIRRDDVTQGADNLFCNFLKPVAYSSSNYENIIYGNTTSSLGYNCIDVRFNESITELTDWKTYLASNNLQVCYKLATPLTIQLTPQQIEALVGQNNLSTPLNGQSIDSVEYREVFAFDDVEKVVSLRVPISMLGTDESGRTTASQSYASGDYFYKDGYMCKALTSISAGATLTLNTNYSQGTLADILKAIENA